MRRRFEVVAACIVFAGGLCFTVNTANANFITANSFVATSCVLDPPQPCMTNDALFYAHTTDLGPQMLIATNGGLSSLNATDINVFPQANPHGSGTDLYYGYEDLPGTTAARYNCAQLASGFRCTHGHVIYDGDQMNLLSAWQQRFTACHETGHSVGLLHGLNGNPQIADADPTLECMRRPIQVGGSNILGTHNNAHINFHY